MFNESSGGAMKFNLSDGSNSSQTSADSSHSRLSTATTTKFSMSSNYNKGRRRSAVENAVNEAGREDTSEPVEVFFGPQRHWTDGQWQNPTHGMYSADEMSSNQDVYSAFMTVHARKKAGGDASIYSVPIVADVDQGNVFDETHKLPNEFSAGLKEIKKNMTSYIRAESKVIRKFNNRKRKAPEGKCCEDD